MTPLRQRMLNDMTVRGLAENTKKSYLNSVTGLARHYRRSPDSVSAQEVQDYLIHLHEQRGLTWKSCNCARHGIRFFYRITLGLPEPHFYLPGAKTPSTLPEILNRDELLRLFTVTTNPKHRALLMTAYAAGLRCSELTCLRVSDIDSGRMLLRVEQGKGSKDRYVPLSPRLLEQLRAYWRRKRPPHWLRHTAACHLVRAGVDINTIRAWLGHSTIDTTNIYAEIDLDMKAEAVALCDASEPEPTRPWKENKGLMTFLKSL